MWKEEKLGKEWVWGESSLNWIQEGALLLKLHPRGYPAEVGAGWLHTTSVSLIDHRSLLGSFGHTLCMRQTFTRQRRRAW